MWHSRRSSRKRERGETNQSEPWKLVSAELFNALMVRVRPEGKEYCSVLHTGKVASIPAGLTHKMHPGGGRTFLERGAVVVLVRRVAVRLDRRYGIRGRGEGWLARSMRCQATEIREALDLSGGT